MRIPNEQGNLGKYDDIAEYAVKKAKANLVLLMVIEGSEGDGFSVSGTDPRLLNGIPAILRDVANKIEQMNRARRTN